MADEWLFLVTPRLKRREFSFYKTMKVSLILLLSIICGVTIIGKASFLKKSQKHLKRNTFETNSIQYDPELRFKFGNHFTNSNGTTIRWNDIKHVKQIYLLFAVSQCPYCQSFLQVLKDFYLEVNKLSQPTSKIAFQSLMIKFPTLSCIGI